MKVLITGGAGFIGSHLADRLLERGDEVLVIDNYATGRRDNLAPSASARRSSRARSRTATLVDEAFDEFEPDVVVHAAACVQGSRTTGREDSRTNALGTANVVRAASAQGVERLIYFQTALCYGTAAAGAADHARATRCDPTVELRDLQDRRRAVHRARAGSTASRSGWPTPTARATSAARCRPSSSA